MDYPIDPNLYLERFLHSEEPTNVKVCIKLPNDMTGEVTLPVNLPYDITKYLIGECGLKIDDTLLSKYWRHKETTLDPLAVATRNYRQMAGTVWPLGFYGDEAAMGLVNAPTHQIFGLYMNVPLYRPRSTRLSRFLMFFVEVEKDYFGGGDYLPCSRGYCRVLQPAHFSWCMWFAISGQ